MLNVYKQSMVFIWIYQYLFYCIHNNNDSNNKDSSDGQLLKP